MVRLDFVGTIARLIISSRGMYRTGQKEKLYVCFVDLKKAFDTVPRNSSWQALEDAGRGPKMMHCVKSIDDTDIAGMHIQTGLSHALHCPIGVKQGCP